jgi:hypothetical protein
MNEEEARALVIAMHQAAWEKYKNQPVPLLPPQANHYTKLTESDAANALGAERKAMSDEEARALVVAMHRAAAEEYRKQPQPPPSSWPRTMHFSELTESDPNSPLGLEWNTYLKNLGRLLQEGHANKHILIKGDQIIGIWDTRDRALMEGRQRFPGQDIFVHQVLEFEPVYLQTFRFRGFPQDADRNVSGQA